MIPAPQFALVALRGEELTEQIVGQLSASSRGGRSTSATVPLPELEPALRDLLRSD